MQSWRLSIPLDVFEVAVDAVPDELESILCLCRTVDGEQKGESGVSFSVRSVSGEPSVSFFSTNISYSKDSSQRTF